MNDDLQFPKAFLCHRRATTQKRESLRRELYAAFWRITDWACITTSNICIMAAFNCRLKVCACGPTVWVWAAIVLLSPLSITMMIYMSAKNTRIFFIFTIISISINHISFRHFSRRIVFVFASSILSSAINVHIGACVRFFLYLSLYLLPTHTSHVVHSIGVADTANMMMPTCLSAHNLLSVSSNGMADVW